MSDVKLILASQSPRRAMLLKAAGYVFFQEKSPFSDPSEPDCDADGVTLAIALAEQKAVALVRGWKSGKEAIRPGVILAADTIGISPGPEPGPEPSSEPSPEPSSEPEPRPGSRLGPEPGPGPGPGRGLIGTPTTAARAREMLESLSDTAHDIVTGVALYDTRSDKMATFADTARVTIGALTDAQIDAHLAAEAWRGKAGGYNLAEVTGVWPITLGAEDDPGTVMGLPMRMLIPRLTAMGVTRG